MTLSENVSYDYLTMHLPILFVQLLNKLAAARARAESARNYAAKIVAKSKPTNEVSEQVWISGPSTDSFSNLSPQGLASNSLHKDAFISI